VTLAPPWRRARPTLRLIDALSSAQAGDADGLAAALSADAAGVLAAAERHRCRAALGEAVRRSGIDERIPVASATVLRRTRLEALLATTRMHRALCAVIEALRETGAPFALLKGAARIYAGEPEAAYHTSDDVDVLVRRSDVAVVTAALLRRGYTDLPDAAAAEDFARHHHAVPLFPPAGSFPVEVHHALARADALSTPTDWEHLAPYFSAVDGPAGPVLRLGPVGSALHLAIHAIGLTRLRDVALLARTLRAFEPADFAALRAVVRAERRDPVRLEAAVLLAARIAGVPWSAAPAVRRYLRWALLREDMPPSLRGRCDAVEAYFAHPGAPWLALGGLVPWWSRGSGLLAAPARILGRCASNAVALLYGALMPSDDRGLGEG
jgi:hypothetical protein